MTAQLAAGVDAGRHLRRVQLGGKDAHRTVHRPQDQQYGQCVRRPTPRQQVDRALAQPGSDQDRAKQIPQAKDQRLPTEGAKVSLQGIV